LPVAGFAWTTFVLQLLALKSYPRVIAGGWISAEPLSFRTAGVGIVSFDG